MPRNAIGPLPLTDRREEAYHVRVRAASVYRTSPIPHHANNGDEDLYPNRIACFTKGLPHNHLGEVDPAVYASFLGALSSGHAPSFENLPLGCGFPSRKLVNPQAGLAFDMEGYDSHLLSIPPAPQFDSDEIGAEIVENYWMALLRDVPFEEYAGNPLASDAAMELNALNDFRGPRIGGVVTPQSLFRGLTPGDVVGPYISQFLVKPVPFGAQGFEQKLKTPLAGIDFVTDFNEWLAVQRGCPRSFSASDFDPTPVYLRNGRDLSQWVHIDVLFQAYFNALLILLQGPDAPTPVGGGIGAAVDAGNPYVLSRTQDGFGTFGGPAIATLLCEVATRALKAVWFQKWYVHRRLRPEAYAGRLHQVKAGVASYPVNAQALNSDAAARTNTKNGTYLLPMAFPEGSPTHPAYGAGHATVAGACVTILKALFDENQVIPDPVFVGPGNTLQPYGGPALTVGGELNKLASNIAIGRNIAGVHWRSDGTESLLLGEQVAIGVLRDHKLVYNEPFGGFTFTSFAGHTMTV
ncbi:MAG: vanadium-dependent haloperoxidase [Candidatus Binatia bacterium]